MSETKNFHQTRSARESADGVYETESDIEAQETTAEQSASAPTPEDVIEKLAKENNELKDSVLRGAAEMENLRKRTAREISDARAYAVSGFARDMLGVADNLSRALSAIAPEERNADSRLKTLAEGLELTERAMHTALERHGVCKIETVGQNLTRISTMPSAPWKIKMCRIILSSMKPKQVI